MQVSPRLPSAFAPAPVPSFFVPHFTCRIDLPSSVFKLAQGVFVAPQPLETQLASSALISRCFVFGEPGDRSTSVAIDVAPQLHGKVSDKVGVAPSAW